MSLALESLGAGCQNNLAVGEAPTEIMTDNVRFLTTLGDEDTIHGQSLSIPQSSFEAFNHIPAPQLSLYLSGLLSSETKGITAHVLSNNPTLTLTNSSQVNINVINYRSDLSSAKYSISTGAEILITLINEEPINYWHISKYNTTIKCFDDISEASFRYAICPGGQKFRVTCPARSRAFFEIRCPHYEATPQCTSRPSGSSTKYEVDESCAVVDFNPFNTTCKCGLRADRRHLTGQQSNTRTYSSTMVVTSSIVAIDFVKAPSLTEVKHSDVILAVMSSFLGLLLIGLMVLIPLSEYDVSKRKSDEAKTNV
jgi:hypothetical protein